MPPGRDQPLSWRERLASLRDVLPPLAMPQVSKLILDAVVGRIPHRSGNLRQDWKLAVQWWAGGVVADARAEYEVSQRFAELTRGRMTVLISHRFSTEWMGIGFRCWSMGPFRSGEPTGTWWLLNFKQ
jgi:hypothetical protein